MKKAFFFCLFVVIGVAAIDTYYNIKYPVIVASEENPIARLILQQGGIALLFSMKLFLTSFVACLLTAAYEKWPKHSVLIVAVLAIVQLFVLFYILT
jgi:hypothetical protein